MECTTPAHTHAESYLERRRALEEEQWQGKKHINENCQQMGKKTFDHKVMSIHQWVRSMMPCLFMVPAAAMDHCLWGRQKELEKLNLQSQAQTRKEKALEVQQKHSEIQQQVEDHSIAVEQHLSSRQERVSLSLPLRMRAMEGRNRV